MSFDLTIIQRAIHTWVSGETELKTIWYNPNAPRPATPYALLSTLTGSVKTGFTDDLKYVSGDTYSISGQRTLSFSIKVIGEGAVHAVSSLQSSLEKPTVLEALRASGLAVWDSGSVQSIPEILETGIEERANLDVLFGVLSSVTDEVGFIEEVEVEEAIYTTPSGSEIDVGPINITV